MLRRLTRSIDIHIGAEGVDVKRPGGPRTCGRSPVDARGQGLRAALQAALVAFGPQARGARARVCVDTAFCWIDVVEGDFAGLGRGAIDAVAQAAISEILGDAVSEHELRWQVQHDGRHMVVLGMPLALLAELHAAAAERELRITSVDAAFVDIWNRCAGQLEMNAGVLAAARSGRATLARVERGMLTAVGHVRVQAGIRDLDLAVRRLCGRFGDAMGAEQKQVLVCGESWALKGLDAWTLIGRPAGERGDTQAGDTSEAAAR